MRLADAYDGFLIDLDGVVWRGEDEIPGVAETIITLRSEGKKVIFITNNAALSPREYAVKLMRHRIPTEPNDIVTSAHAVVDHLRDSGIRRDDRIYLVAAEGLAHVLRARGYEPTKDPEGAVALVVAWDPKLTYDDIKVAADLARSGVLFVGANRDVTYPSGDGLLPGTGAILAAIEAASGRRATVVGKPKPTLFRYALECSETPSDRTLLCGDRPDSDIAGARAAGIPSALVLTGVTTPDRVSDVSHEPDWVMDDLSGLISENGARRWKSSDRLESRVGSAAPAERHYEQHPRDEATGMREESHSALVLPTKTGQASEDLDDEPEPQNHPGFHADGEEDETQREYRDDRRGRPEDGVRAQDTGDRTGGTDNRDEGIRIERYVSERGSETGSEVEDHETYTSQSIFDVVTEDPEEQHVEGEMQDVGMDEHRSEEREERRPFVERRAHAWRERGTPTENIAGDGGVSENLTRIRDAYGQEDEHVGRDD